MNDVAMTAGEIKPPDRHSGASDPKAPSKEIGGEILVGGLFP